MNKKTLISLSLVSALITGITFTTQESTLAATANQVKTYTIQDLNRIKLYAKITDSYNKLKSFNNSLFIVESGIGTASVVLMKERNIGVLTHQDQMLKDLEPPFKSLELQINAIVAEAAKSQINLSDMKTILSQYKQALDLDRESINKLYLFTAAPNQNVINEYYNLNFQAANIRIEAVGAADKGYQNYYQKITNYK